MKQSVTAPNEEAERLVDVYRRWFEVVPADTDALRESAYRLRYQVYCVENPYEDPAANSSGLETDEFDAHSEHSLLIHRPTGLVAGTVRIVLPLTKTPERSFAIQRICDDPALRDPKRFPIARIGEISRFSISKDFRKRREDLKYPAPLTASGKKEDERRVIPHMTLGLIEALVTMSVRYKLTHWCAVMEPQLLRLLTRLGIYFEHIGPLVQYHGLRQPCIVPLDVLLPRVQQEREDVWEILTNEGEHWDAFRAMASSLGKTAPVPRMAKVS